jgi:hypothetical protein
MTLLRIFLALGLVSALLPASALAGAEAIPEGPEQRITIVRGQPIRLPELAEREGGLDEVELAIDGKGFQTDHFPPYGDYIPTRRFDRLGFAVEVEHILTASTVDFFSETRTELARYPLVIHPLPVIPRVHVFPLVVKKQTRLVGFQLRGIAPGAQVKAWGHGFLYRRGRFELPLRRRKTGSSSRTYVVPGGLLWRRHTHPHLIFSFGPPRDEFIFGVAPRGRIFTAVVRTKRNGDTGLRQTDNWKKCAYGLTWNGGPPHMASCFYLF